MIRFIRKNPGLFVAVVVSVIVFAVAELGKAYLMGELVGGKMTWESVMELGGITALFLVVYVSASSIKSALMQKFENKARYDLLMWLGDWSMRMSPSEMEARDSSAFINTMTNKADQIIEKCVHSYMLMINLVISFVVGSVYILSYNALMLVFMYVCTGLTLWLNKRFAPRLESNQKTLLAQKERWIQTIKNFYKNFLNIRNENVETLYSRSLQKENRALRAASDKANGFLVVSDALNDGIGQFMFFGVLVFGALLISTGHMTVAILMAVVQVSNMVANPIFQFATLKNRILSSRFLLGEMEAEEQRVLEHNKRETISLPALRSITLDHLDFAYPNGKTVFHDVSHTFRQGSKTLIVGPSGEGKSTLLKLLLKQIPSSNVKADGAPLDQVRYGSYFSHIAYVSQTLSLFPMTLKENIVLGKDKPVEPVLKQVRLMDLNERQNEVFDSDSMMLSGGQIQRVVLGRAIASDKEWVVLDEAFSAIDEATRQSIEMAFLNDPAKTVIAVSHHIDPDVAARYDEILLVKNGTLRPITLEALKEEMKKRW